MNKFLYKKAYWLYFIIAHIRMFYYICTKQKDKSIDIIYEGFKW